MLSLILPQVNLSVGEAGRPLEATTGARLVLDFYPTPTTHVLGNQTGRTLLGMPGPPTPSRSCKCQPSRREASSFL